VRCGGCEGPCAQSHANLRLTHAMVGEDGVRHLCSMQTYV